MTESNRLRVVRKNRKINGTLATPNIGQQLAAVSESLAYNVDYSRSERITGDRNNPFNDALAARANGGFNNEFSYQMNKSEIESALFQQFTKIAEIENFTADTEIAGVDNATDTITVASGGAAFKAGHLVQLTGFTNANNSGIFKVGSSTATTIVLAGTPTLTDEAAPPLGAKVKVVGFEGASGDITATATGLASSALDFTTLGLTVGAWIKIGGSATANKFAGAALNGYARITAITANAITLNNRPTGWTTDAGTDKLLQVWVSDHAKNGSTRITHTYEKSFQGQDTPSYYQYEDMMCNTLDLSIATGGRADLTVEFLGTQEIVSGTSADAAPRPILDETAFNGTRNVSRVIENGAPIGSSNKASSFSVNINNNLSERYGLGDFYPFDQQVGDCDVTGEVATYFGSDALVAKYVNSTRTNVGIIFERDEQSVVIFIPTCKFTAATYNAGGRNQDVFANLTYNAETSANNVYSVSFDMFDYLEN